MRSALFSLAPRSQTPLTTTMTRATAGGTATPAPSTGGRLGMEAPRLGVQMRRLRLVRWSAVRPTLGLAAPKVAVPLVLKEAVVIPVPQAVEGVAQVPMFEGQVA